MPVSVNTSGSQTATITTEHTLATITTAVTLILSVDVAAMLGGTTPDILELRIYGKARTGDTERLIKTWGFLGAQVETLFLSVPIASPHYYKATLKQTQGTGRAFPWAIYQL